MTVPQLVVVFATGTWFGFKTYRTAEDMQPDGDAIVMVTVIRLVAVVAFFSLVFGWLLR